MPIHQNTEIEVPGGEMGVSVAVTVTRSKFPHWMRRLVNEVVLKEMIRRAFDYVSELGGMLLLRCHQLAIRDRLPRHRAEQRLHPVGRVNPTIPLIQPEREFVDVVP